ncbi:MAG: peptidoglycan-binding protein [Solobacterium sp.]|nr:peptidoglycan-binding protein [Solobacterium sp.]
MVRDKINNTIGVFMSENKQEKDDVVRLQVTRHLWPEEQEIKDLKKNNKRLSILCYVLLLLLVAVLGGFVGYIRMRRSVPVASNAVGNEKLEEALSLMKNNWYFAHEIENVEERLVDQAIEGMAQNEEDHHTEYMSKEERESFYQSINRSYVGIGVQFLSTADGVHMIERIIEGAPAENSGIQPGDIIYAVDGVNVQEKTSDEVVALVQGEEGTSVHIDFLRNGEIVGFDIVRAPFQTTTYYETLDDVGYIELAQFGETSESECRKIIDRFKENGIEKLIIDLRNDGGGYLYVLQSMMGLFVDHNQTVLIEEFADGSRDALNAMGTPIWDKPVVILVNNGTASASEAFVIAMKELYPNVTVVGTKTYGKGTVQVSYVFGDGSAIKYTTSKWLSPSGISINGEGIEPDVVVESPYDKFTTYYLMEEEEVYTVDQVSPFVSAVQECLTYLGYEVDREDGYFSEGTKDVILKFQKDYGLEETGNIDQVTYQTAISTVIRDFNTNHEKDTQLQKALELLHE